MCFQVDEEADLYTFSFSHESALLSEPWPSSVKTPSGKPIWARACLFGPDCQGMSPELPGHAQCGGVVLTEAMTPAELEAFESRGAHPAVRRACILCCRAFTMDAFLQHNKNSPAPKRLRFNWYVNPVECADGYSARVCIPSPGTDDTWTGIYGHVVMHALNNLRLLQSPGTRRWTVNQEALRAV